MSRALDSFIATPNDLAIDRGQDFFWFRHFTVRYTEPSLGNDGPPRVFSAHVRVALTPPPAPDQALAFFVNGADAYDAIGADPVLAGLGEILGIGADHLAHDPGDVDLAHRRLSGDPAVAQDGDEVADADQLLQAMRDVDDGDAARLEVANLSI